jgi:hypothetical protein
MGKRRLTPAKERAYLDLARAARRLRRTQDRAQKAKPPTDVPPEVDGFLWR